jgi:hypothetical protein
MKVSKQTFHLPDRLSLLFEKNATALLNGAFDAPCDGRQNPGELELNPDASIFDIDVSARRLSSQTHSEVEAVAGPHSPFDGDQPSERSDNLIDARFYTPPRLCSAEPMGNGYDNRVGHSCPYLPGSALKLMWAKGP